jgi:hypothetical protein
MLYIRFYQTRRMIVSTPWPGSLADASDYALAAAGSYEANRVNLIDEHGKLLVTHEVGPTKG